VALLIAGYEEDGPSLYVTPHCATSEPS
jgi:hypothetical protein